MKKTKKSKEFLEQLRKIPIVLVACEKCGLSRNTIYRWRKEDEDFAKEMDEALQEGADLVNDMTESQLLTLIKEKEWSAISFWLRHRNPKFKERLEITAKIEKENVLTPEQKALVEKAVEFASRIANVETKQKNNEKRD